MEAPLDLCMVSLTAYYTPAASRVHAYSCPPPFSHAAQVLDLSQTPNLETPQYSVLRVTRDYEVRRYEPFVVAEAPMGPGASECH